MKKLLETSLGNNSTTWFSIDGARVSRDNALELIEDECNPYVTKDNDGVLIYMSKQEYEALLKLKK